ncbi:hypothetical protein VTI74DRAFT_8219 [Chaetomium olivicolor]
MSDLLVHGPGSPRLASPISPAKLRRRLSKGHGSSQLSRLVRGANDVVLSWQDGLSEEEREDKRRTEERKQILAARMQSATTLEEWERAARELDRLEGNNKWKLDDGPGDCEYEPDLIKAKIKELDTARTNCDVDAMMYLIRTELSRDIGGIGNADLYRHAYIGTKSLIERYVASAVQTIEAVVEKSTHQTEMSARDLLDGMVYARQNFGRSALLLSGGATFGMSHIGVVKTLFEQGLLPRVVSGASAGSIVCSVLCTRKDEEIPTLIKSFPFGDLAVFESEDESYWDHLRSLFTKGSWSDISNLTRVMRAWLGDVTFLEAYNRTRRICNICVSSASIYDVPRLLNYATAPNVIIWSAVAASCSVPLVFQAHPLLIKNPETGLPEPWAPAPQHYIDGSVDNDLPMTRLAEMFNVNHFIVAQVNPHIVPFLDKEEQRIPGKPPPKKRAPPSTSSVWLSKIAAAAIDEGLYRMHFLTEIGVFPNLLTKLLSVLTQQYSGDITILPEIAMSDLPVMLKNPTPEFMQRNCLVGERATWPKLSRIRDRLSIELALDQAVHALRTKVVFSASQVDMRRAMGVWQPVYYGSGSRSTAGHEFGLTSVGGGDGDTLNVPLMTRRRRGSGASIQLVAARHRKAFEHLLENDEDGRADEELEDEYDDDGERIELVVGKGKGKGPGSSSAVPAAAAGVASGRRRTRSTRGMRTATAGGIAGGNSQGFGASAEAVRKPRLRRNAKSHGHMRAGLPILEAPSVGSLTQSQQKEEEQGEGSWVGVGEEEGSGGVSEAWSELAAPGVEQAEGVLTVDVTEAEGGTQGSDGGLLSDADPYSSLQARRAGSPRRKGSGLRHEETY